MKMIINGFKYMLRFLDFLRVLAAAQVNVTCEILIIDLQFILHYILKYFIHKIQINFSLSFYLLFNFMLCGIDNHMLCGL